MGGFRIEGSVSGNVAEVDSNNNLKANLPTVSSQAGFAQLTYNPNSSNVKPLQVTEYGIGLFSKQTPSFQLSFNGAGTQTTKIGTNATTMAKAVTNGFMRLNSGSITTTTTGISIYSYRVFEISAEKETHITFNIKHTNAAATNKQMEWGLGYYGFAAGQAAAMNEFIGFRVTAGGVLQGVLAYSTGGAPTETTVNINSGVPFTDGQVKEYELRISNRKIEFWANGTLQNTIAIATDVYSVIKGVGYPVIARVFNSGAASAAPILDVGTISVAEIGFQAECEEGTIKAKQGNGTHYYQPDLQTGAGTNPMNFPATGAGATAATGSNTASVLNNAAILGGMYAMNGASITAANANVLVSSFQNPVIPTANGAGNNGRNLIITGLSISPTVVTTVLVGGPYAAVWFAAVGNSATSLATTDADGTTAIPTKAPRLIPLTRIQSYAASAAAGTIETGSGDTQYTFRTPIVVHPSEFFSLGLRVLSATAVTSGVISGQIYVNGYWE